MSLGQNIRRIREIKNISLEEMVKKLSTFKRSYVNIEKGLVKPSRDILLKIADIFDISEIDIINFKEDLFINTSKNLDIRNLKDIVSGQLSRKSQTFKTILTPVTKTPINVVLEDLSIKEVAYKKPMLLKSSEIFQLGDNIKKVDVRDSLPSQTLIKDSGELDPNLVIDDDRSFSSKLLNWTEPFTISGVQKTLFYTEFNTGLKPGDKVFIINGNFDSNKFIEDNPYKNGVDGYTVLFVDKCRVVLDIDYTEGKLPFLEEPIDNFTNVYYFNTQSDFLQANRHISSRDNPSGDMVKFRNGRGNIAFFDGEFSEISNPWGETVGGITQSGFYIKDSNKEWKNITASFSSGDISVATNSTVSDKIKIHNGSFTFSTGSSIINFQEGMVYEWSEVSSVDGIFGTVSTWLLKNEYNVPFITKSNFRKGDFNGVFNSGVFGNGDNRITWDKDTFQNATWNTGTLLNVDWLSGDMNSINSLPESFVAEFGDNGEPYQKLNGPNNNGYGFNYIENSNLNKAHVENGIFEKSIIGDFITQSLLEQHIAGITISSDLKIEKSLLKNSQILSGFIKNSDIVNSRVSNSKLENVKSINSNYKQSVIKDSVYISDDIIKIIGYDEFNVAEIESFSASNYASHKVYKFYIRKQDYDKIKVRDRFYIKGLRILDESKYPLNFFDRKFRLSSWTEYFDSYKDNQFIKRGVDIGVFLSTPADNEFKLNYLISPNRTITTIKNESQRYSIDIFVSLIDKNGDLFENDPFTNELPINGLSINTLVEPSVSKEEPSSLGNNIDISEAYIVNSDFESGIVENTDWISGDNINYQNDVNIVHNNFGTYSIIAITQSSELIIQTNYDDNHKEIGDTCLDVGNIVFLGNIEYESPSGDILKLGDTYKIVETFDNNNQLRLKEISTDYISSITQSGGTFSTSDAQNRYAYIHKSKIDKSKIKSGIFRRSYITGSFIENNRFDINDRDFDDIPKLKKLVISDSIFKDNENILSSALYMNSSFVSGNDDFKNGIVYNSIWNGLTFSNGVFKQSRWVNGEFLEGFFYNNRSFNGVTSSNALMYNSERIKSYYKDGLTSATESNDRYSWQDGQFNSGEFFESDWENGDFNSGKLYYSKFYNGIINGGVIGDTSVPINNTHIFNALINFTTVDNAKVLATDNSSGLTSSIVWKDGIFNDGEFGSDDNHVAIWEDGQFNNGNFINMAIWKDGTFNGGRFLSTYGWTMSESLSQSDYTWQDGIFNGGEFGNSNGASNSTWFTGEFNGGKFRGRVWNNGILTNGDFKGSATYSAIRGVTPNSSNAVLFTDSFSSYYFGLWRDGIVSDKKDDFIKNSLILSPKVRNKDRKKSTDVKIENSLWISGTFSHSSGTIENSVWLNGVFERGTFFKSSFNPFVKRDGATQSSFELSDSCKWNNGQLLDSDFYISKWEKGRFNTGDAYGMIWKDGICDYMNAFNIFWENGTWRNGNWYGSFINYEGDVKSEFYKEILLRGASWSGTQSMHLWNIFDDSSSAATVSSSTASSPTVLLPGSSIQGPSL